MSAARRAPAAPPEPAVPLQATGVVASRLMMGREAMAWTLPEQIAVAVGDRILSEDFAPGSRIGEESLAAEFQVSRGPIRDALRVLEHVGLVTIHTRRGATASMLTPEDLREILEVRLTLLLPALHGFARAPGAELLQQLRRHLSALEALAGEERYTLLFTDALDRIMLFVAHHCGNRRIGSILTTLSLQSFRYLRRGHTRGPNAEAGRAASLRFYRDYTRACEEGGSIEPLLPHLNQIYVDRARYIGDYLP
jgi:DNA-binding GntR family transcriptional regulator